MSWPQSRDGSRHGAPRLFTVQSKMTPVSGALSLWLVREHGKWCTRLLAETCGSSHRVVNLLIR
jgi:hypothetical protein